MGKKKKVNSNYRKVTNGFVIQVYDPKGKPLSQEFIAGEVEYETTEGEGLDPSDLPIEQEQYLPFLMKQPHEQEISYAAIQEVALNFLSANLDDDLVQSLNESSGMNWNLSQWEKTILKLKEKG